MHNRLFSLLAALLLSACAAKFTAEPKPATANILAQKSEDFLFLSARDAIRQGQGELAIQFLTALIKKNPQATEPRLQLAELLLRGNRVEEAVMHLDAVITSSDAVQPEQKLDATILKARALAMTNQRDEALELLDPLLEKHPGILDARILQISILASLNRLDEAQFSIADGLLQEKSSQLYKISADLYLRQNRTSEAVAALEEMQKLDPDDETPILLLSQIAQQQQNQVRAEQILRDYLETHPESLLVRNALGRILVQSGRIPEAITIYKGIVRDTGGTSEAHATLGLLYFQSEQYAEAAKAFEKAVRASGDEQSLFYLAASLEATGRKHVAAAKYLKIGKESKLYLDAQIRVAGIELSDEKTGAAKKRAKALIARFPKAGEPYLVLSAAYVTEKRYRELIDETGPALELPDIPPRLLFNRAIAFEHFKAYDGVEKSLEQLLQIDPEHAEALNFLGYTYAEQGIKLDKAEELIRRALEKSPEDGYYLDSLAWVYFKRGDYPEAVELQARAIGKIPEDPVMQEHMGDMLWMQGRSDEARKSWNKALKLKHDNPDLIRKKIAEGLKKP